MPELWLVEVCRVLCSRQHLRLSTGGDQLEVLGRAEAEGSVQLSVQDHGGNVEAREEVSPVPGGHGGHGHPARDLRG